MIPTSKVVAIWAFPLEVMICLACVYYTFDSKNNSTMQYLWNVSVVNVPDFLPLPFWSADEICYIVWVILNSF